MAGEGEQEREEKERRTYEDVFIVGEKGEMGGGRVEESDVVDVDVYCAGGAWFYGRRGSGNDVAVDEDGGLGGNGAEEGVVGQAVVDDELGGARVVCDGEEGLCDGPDVSFWEEVSGENDTGAEMDGGERTAGVGWEWVWAG